VECLHAKLRIRPRPDCRHGANPYSVDETHWETMDHINAQLDALAEFHDEQVAELQNAIISEFEVVEGEEPTPETVDAMTSLADSLDTVRGELSRREALAADLPRQQKPPHVLRVQTTPRKWRGF